MSVDLRTTLDSCDATGTWVGDGSVSTDNTAGFVYEGTNALSTQHSNVDEHLYETITQVDLSDATCYLILKDNLVETLTNGGVQFVLGDGTDRVGYGCGGNNATGIQLDVFWNSYKFDTTTTAPYTNVYAGVLGNNNLATVTQVGLGTVHLAKAQGNVDNIKLDRLSYHANGSYGIRINGGTVGTPETMADVTGDSITNGWGVFSNPNGSLYNFFAPTEIGNPTATADVYFEAFNEQWVWDGGNVASTHFPFRIVGNATDTISVVMNGVSIVNVGRRADFTVGDTNVDTIDWDAVSLTGLGDVTFPASSVTRTHDGVSFSGCSQVYPNACNGTDWTVIDGLASGMMVLDTAGDSDNLDGVSFVNNGTAHAIVITATGTYEFSNFTYSGFSGTGNNAPIYNNSGGAVTINVTGGDTPTVRNGAGASTTVNASVPISITVQTGAGDPIQNAKVFLELVSDGTDIISYGVTNASGVVSTTFSGSTPADVTGYVAKGTSLPVYKRANINDTISSTGLSATITMSPD